jgi:hypothetical protein
MTMAEFQRDWEPDARALLPDREQHIVERAVLGLALAFYPGQLTIDDLRRELNGHTDDSAENDDVDCAVRDLVSAGLLYCHSGMVGPTSAARRFDVLGL